MQEYSISPLELVNSAWRNRELIKALTVREVVSRYRGSVFGLMWSFFNPVFMLAVYTFVFSVVFKSRWHAGSTSKGEFAIVLFAGLIVFYVFTECVNRAPGIILSNTNYVKRVVFPLEILPIVSLAAALFHALVSLVVWFIFYFIVFGLPPSTIWLFPFVILPLIAITVGCSWFLASLGVFLRDIGQVVGILTTALTFLSPLFFPASALPAEYQRLFLLNPMAPVIEEARDVLIWGDVPSIKSYLAYLLFSTIVAWLGFAWFQKTRKGFSDAI